ncbi:MAG: MBL fold metallo-hydrolase [Candidatus Aenigmarchaeota archaeon]|nr:MBL fold metallo-hydrolase [Candidatus Aenigmarchaeota archaeon]MDW8149585.1 MBL fold metallo-hydrolase [Candidatus Aenigmarchaeota archaeon]
MVLKYKNISIEWLGHDGFKIMGSKTVYIDVFKIREQKEKADILLITHEHFDHLSLDDIKKVIKEQTVIVAPKICENNLKSIKNKKLFVLPFDKIEVENTKIEVYPSYNLNKKFHPKEDGRVGYVLEIDSVRIFHSGDSDFIPEFKELKNIDVALLPVSGVYVMDWEEAAEAALAINPKIAVPMHYNSIVGTTEDAKNFAKALEGKIQTFIF